MKAITLHQPWATLIATGAKRRRAPVPPKPKRSQSARPKPKPEPIRTPSEMHVGIEAGSSTTADGRNPWPQIWAEQIDEGNDYNLPAECRTAAREWKALQGAAAGGSADPYDYTGRAGSVSV